MNTRRCVALLVCLMLAVVAIRVLVPRVESHAPSGLPQISAHAPSALPQISADDIDLGLSHARDVEALVAAMEGVRDLPRSSAAQPARSQFDAAASRDPWWSSLPRTGIDIYHDFVINPAAIEGNQLLRNEVLNPPDVELPRIEALAFLAWYATQVQIAQQARNLVGKARRALAEALERAGRLPVYTPTSLASMTLVKDGTVVSGADLVRAAQARLGSGASETSIVVNALMMLGECGPGSTVHVRGGKVGLLPRETSNKDIESLIELEKRIVLEIVGVTHNWFAANGLVFSADVFLKAASLIEREPR